MRRSAYDLRCERVLWGVLAAHALLIIAVVVVARFGARLLSA
ncbi:MAG: hypothetical protein SFY69_01260 [Planctomycetota bacterium]|nr:hypothetical protein [Planctomycetota bacterium]